MIIFARPGCVTPQNNNITITDSIETSVALTRENDRKTDILIVSTLEHVFSDSIIADDFRASLEVSGKTLPPSAQYLDRCLFVASFARTLLHIEEHVKKAAWLLASRCPSIMLNDAAEKVLCDAIPDLDIEAGPAPLNIRTSALHYFREFYAENKSEAWSMCRISDDNPNVVRVKMGYAEAVEYAKENGGIIALCGKPGDGKTSKMLRPLFEHGCEAGKRPIMMTPRVSHCSAFENDPRHYTSAGPGGYFDAPGLVGVSNSICLLSAFKEYLNISEMVLLDEFEQLLTHNVSSAIRSGSLTARGFVTAATYDLIKDAAERGVAVISDALLNDYSVNRLSEITGRKVILIEGEAETTSRTLRIHKSPDDALAEATQMIADGKNVMFMSGMSHNQMKDDLDGLFKHVSQFAPEDKSILIDGDFFSNIENKAATANLGEYLSGYQVVVSSPVINSAVSIETSHFDAMFIISTGTELPTEALQSTRRIRALDTVNIAFDIKQRDRSTTSAVVFENLAARTIKENMFSLENLADLWEKPGVQDVVRRVCFENNMRRNYANRLALMSESIGFNIEHVEASEADRERAKEARKAASAEAEADRVQGALNAAHPSREKAGDMRNSGKQLSRDEARQLVRFDTCKFYNIQPQALNEEIMEDDENGKQRNKIRNLQLLRIDDTRTMTAHEKMRRTILRKIFKSLDLDTSSSLVEGSEFTSKRAQSFLAWLNNKRSKVTINKTEISAARAFLSAFDCATIGKDATKLVNRILRRELGLTVKQEKQAKEVGGTVTIYTVRMSEKLSKYYDMATLKRVTYNTAPLVNGRELIEKLSGAYKFSQKIDPTWMVTHRKIDEVFAFGIISTLKSLGSTDSRKVEEQDESSTDWTQELMDLAG